MKNKKLFAILTLVCFMMTLMPVAAFAATETVYAEVNEDSEYVDTNDTIDVDVTHGAADAEYYVWAEKDGKVFKGTGFVETTGSAIEFGPIDTAGTYKIYVADKNDYTNAAYAARTTNGRDKTATLLKDGAKVVMLDNTVVVKALSSEYKLTVDAEATEGNWNNETKTLTLAADSGYSEFDVYVHLEDASQKDVVGATLKVSTNSAAVDVTPDEAKTNAAGLAKFTVSSSIAGNFKVYVEYGTKTDLTINVKSNGLAAANVTNIKEPKAPVALDSDLHYDNVEAFFNVTDANGNNTGLVQYSVVEDEETGKEVVTKANYRVVVTEKPAGAKINGEDITLESTPNGWGFVSTESLDVEGTYTFKVVLNNGNYATATVEVKEFQKPVELVVEYPTNAVELNGITAPTSINFVDANGVTKAATNIELSATGYAVADFYADDTFKTVGEGEEVLVATAGTVKVKDNEKYVGSKITVLAVSTKYNLTDTVELVVANEASAVKYANTKADVAVNNTLIANIVDQDGNKVALNTTAQTNNADVQYIVLDKPENAKVAVSTKDGLVDLAKKGQFKVSFTASEIGTYKLQTVVRYEQAGADKDEPVVKYYSGIEEITVGNTGFEDIVVMSVNSNEIVVNAETVTIDAAPIVKNDRTFVPFRALAEAFGAEVAFDEATQAVTAELNGTTVVMTIGSATYTINGVEKTMDVAPFINGSRTMIPVRFAAEAFGITVTPTYDENGATADVLFAK